MNFFCNNIIKLNQPNDIAFSNIAQKAVVQLQQYHPDIKFLYMEIG